MTLLDWDNPPQLTIRKRQARDLDALARVHAKRAKHKGSKSHATNKERSHEERAKAEKRAKRDELAKKARAAFLEAVRAYWRGEGEHP